MRVLRESRRTTYASFAETHDQYIDLLSNTLTLLGRIDRFPDQREVLVEKAHKCWNKALKFRKTQVQRIRALLYLDATPQVCDAAKELATMCALLS